MNMKIKPDHYTYLVDELRKGVASIGKQKINEHITILAGIPKDLHKRIRWDLAHASGLEPFFCSTLYEYMNKDHIDTALKHAVKAIDLPRLLSE